MAHLTRAALKSNCIDYKSSFVHSELERVKITQTFADGSTKTKKCPTFLGEFGIESLLYVEERFRNFARQLLFDTGPELFDNFEEILTDSAEEKWENLVSGIGAAARTVPRFNAEMQNLYLRYVDTEARDTMIKYLPTCRKPRDAEPRTHVDSMETLMRYANMLPGTELALNEQQKKNLIFEIFPVKWRQNYIRAGKSIATDYLAEIFQYMSNEKGIADVDDKMNKEKKRKPDDQGKNANLKRIRGGYDDKKRKKNINGNNKNGKPGPNDPCPWHGPGHKWRQCFDNPDGDSFRSREGRGGSGRGSFGGRGNHGGRGDGGRGGRGGFSGGRGNGNGSYYNENQYHPNHQGNGHGSQPDAHYYNADPAQRAPSEGWQAESYPFARIGDQGGSRQERGGNGYGPRGSHQGGRW
jgi:hypothetical protein